MLQISLIYYKGVIHPPIRFTVNMGGGGWKNLINGVTSTTYITREYFILNGAGYLTGTMDFLEKNFRGIYHVKCQTKMAENTN